ncbi:methyl-accepting chemotaxis protein [Tabrizicola sp.]|uniref:methyl-accepting chemotaxis protein n=1 Tax=Tabrizicola sp. TaxID=2005166 RepID=UPI0035B35240
MLSMNNVPMKYKLPAIIVGMCLTVGAALQASNSISFRQSAIESAIRLFETIGEGHEADLLGWKQEHAAVLRGLASTPATAQALKELADAIHAAPGGEAALRRAYVDENPMPAGEHKAYDRAPGPETYHAVHAWVNPWFREVARLDDFYDMFLIDLHGDLNYTLAKEADFLGNVKTGTLAGSALSKVVELALAGKPGETFLSDMEPYAPSNGTLAIFMATPITNAQGAVQGVLAVQLNGDKLAEILNADVKPGQSLEAFVVGPDGRSRTASHVEEGFAQYTQLPTDLPQIRAAMAGEDVLIEDAVDVHGDAILARVIPLKEIGNGWSLVVNENWSDVLAEPNATLRNMLLFTGFLALVALVTGTLLARSITRPMQRQTATLHEMANGKLDLEVQDTGRGDDLGDIARSVATLLEKLREADLASQERARMEEDLRLVVERMRAAMQRLAEGDLSSPIDQAFSPEYEVLRVNYNQTLAKLNATISQVVGVAESIRARSTEINHASVDLSRRTENQAAALEETAAALDALTASVKANADGASEVEATVRTARAEAEESGTVVKAAVSKMTEIQRSSEQISNISGAIEDIAFQTNLLALNAGVEAARAGDAGKGFAVVASEVRALAQRSSEAAKEIKALITTSGQHVRTGVDQVNRAGTVIEAIVGRVAHISDLVSNIASGAAEQSSGLGEINIGVTQLDRVTQQNAAMVEESSAASQGLQQDATTLAGLVSHFRIEAGQGALLLTPALASKPMSENVANTTTAPVSRARASGDAAQGVWQDF